MSDALTCGLTQRFRVALGYDNVVDVGSGWYLAGEVTGTVAGLAIPGPCGKAALVKGAINSLRVAQGAGSAINAAEAMQNGDVGGFLLHGAGAMFAFGRFNACFAAGTPIPIEQGCKGIKQIREGDIVLMRNEHDPIAPPIKGRVLATFSTTAPVWELTVAGRTVRTTAGHPFWVRGKGWTAAVDLRPRQELRTDTDWVTVDGVRDTGESETVYNFEVGGEHTYFAGDPVTWGWALWAHNAGGCGPVLKGQKGLRAARIVQNTKRIESLSGKARYRVPDGLNKPKRVLDEVKNSTPVNLTNQLRDYADWAAANGYVFNLWVKMQAQLSGPLQKLIDGGAIALQRF
jgi:hypothetical protein